MYNLFEFFYNPESVGIIVYWAIMPFLIILSIIFLTISLVVTFKTKKLYAKISLAISFILFYLMLPACFELLAIHSSGDLNPDNINLTMGKDIEHDKGYINNLERAIKVSLFPAQKGFLQLSLANYYVFDNDLSIENYEKAFHYLKRYDNILWTHAIVRYYVRGDFDKVIAISNANEVYVSTAQAYIMKHDYENALYWINKAINKNPQSAGSIAIRSNIYRNLGDENSARKDYLKALRYCKDEKTQGYVNSLYKNKNQIEEMWKNMKTHYDNVSKR